MDKTTARAAESPADGSDAGVNTRTLFTQHDWAGTLGAREGWPSCLNAAAGMILQAHVPMCLLIGQKGVLIYNDAFAASLGERHPASFGSSIFESFPEAADFSRAALEAASRGEPVSQAGQTTMPASAAEGQLWRMLDYSPLPDEDGRAIGLLAIASEARSRRSAEQALARSNERLALAVLASGIVGAWDWDIRSNLVTADRHFAEMFGVDPELAASGAPIETFAAGVHPEDRALVTDTIEAALKSRSDYRAEYRLINGGGEPRWVLATGKVVADADGRALRLPGVVIDITERKRAEAALAESEAKFRTIADTMPQMVWSTLPDGLHDYYNARWYEFTGVPEGSTDGEGWNGMFHPDDQERAWAAWQRSLRTGEPYQIEYRLRHHSGVYRWTLGRALPVRDSRGRITRWFGTCTDIHETKLAAEEREIVAQELSHRIKNIFSVLNGIIALSARTHPQLKPLADQLRSRVSALGQAHDYVRPHSKASRPDPVKTSLQGLLTTLLAPYRLGGGSRIAIQGEDPMIDDRSATPLALLFHELSTNSAKYGALSKREGRINVAFEAQAGTLVIVWKEKGVEIPAGVPAHEGFGTRLIALSVEGQLGGKVRRSWEPDGLRVEIEIPATSLSRTAMVSNWVEAGPISRRA
jgi:PAS domain S-box-containing protein